MNPNEQVVYILNEQYPGLSPTQFGFQTCSPGHSYGPCVRPFWLLHYVISGTGIFTRSGTTYTISPGEIFVIPPGVETYYEADRQNPWNYIWIGFEYDRQMPQVFDAPVLRIPGAGEIFQEMRRCQGMEGGQSAYLSSRIWALVARALEAGKKPLDYIERALNYISTSYMQDISATALADVLNLDRSYFSTIFKERLGVSPGKYIQNYRLNKAVELMTVQGESISVAAISVGYLDICNFSKAFKQKYGLSPRAYLKRESKREKTSC